MSIKHKLYPVIAFLGILVLFAGACAETAPSQADELESVRWILEQYGAKGNPEAVLEGQDVTATFDSAEGQVNGSASCNHYFGGYEVSKNTLTISQLGQTEMYCVDPEGIMEQEQQYLKILQAAESYQIRNGKLTIDCGDNVLIYRTAEE